MKPLKVAYLTPARHYDFFREVVGLLRDRGLDVSVNVEPGNADIILPCMLPATPEWLPYCEKDPGKVVFWHWDLYSFVDLSHERWARALAVMAGCRRVWSCGYEVARQLREVFNLDSDVVTAWVRPGNWDHCRGGAVGDYAFYAASSSALGKRVDWAERACQMLGVPLVLSHHQHLPRDEYYRTLTGCRFYLMTAFEESNGTIPALEAAAAGRPVVCADIPSNREVFGHHAHYFRNDSFGGLLGAARACMAAPPDDALSRRVLAAFGIGAVADRMASFLRGLA